MTDSWSIINADCSTLTLEPSSIDALITDPPAGIGFMGKAWDGDRGGRDKWIAWLAEALRPAFVALKPGAHGLVWALPRTSHWTAMALELCGFEIRDRVSHLFGCVPPETEMLTERGWILRDDLQIGENVAQVDARGFVTFGPLEAVQSYPYDGPMLRISTRSTEQLLTPGHTVHVYPKRAKWRRYEIDGEMSAITADALTEDQRGVIGWCLPLAARGAAPQATLESPDVAALYGWVITEGTFSHGDTPAVSIFQNEGHNANVIRGLLARLEIPHSEYRRTRDDYDGTPRENVQWYIKCGPWADRLRRDLAGDKPTPPQWLAWLPLEHARALFDALVAGDGSVTGPRCGAWYQKDPTVRAWFQTLCFRLGMRTRENVAKMSISWCTLDTTEVQRGKHRARWLSSAPYTGEVWCPTVSTGRWVARYRGCVFITGNSGFPKSLDVSKAIDAHFGAERAVVGRGAAACVYLDRGEACQGHDNGTLSPTVHAPKTAPATPEAAQWDGWGTALKPACEDWWLVRKPLRGTVARNVLEYGTGGLNIDGCRIGTDEDTRRNARGGDNGMLGSSTFRIRERRADEKPQSTGRWPAHLVLSHCDDCTDDACSDGCAVLMLDEQGNGASRFFYVAKPSTREKSAGLDGRNDHPTVKPVELMRWLCRLITPPGGTILDPFAGSGTTGVAAALEGFRFVGVEQDPSHADKARKRIDHVLQRHGKDAK